MRFIKITFTVILILFFLFTAGVVSFGLIYGDEIKGYVVENINKNIRTEVEVSNVDFSVWESFPFASVVFTDVVIHSVDAKNDTLLAAKKVAVQLNLSDLLQKRYKLTGLEISDGKCNMLIDNSGRANYIFWNQNDSAKGNGFKTQLEKVSVNDMDFTYADYSKNVQVSFSIDEAELSGSFYESIFDLKVKSTLKETILRIGDLSLFENRTLFIYADGKVDQNKQEISFTNSNLGIDEMNLTVDGNYLFGKKTSQINATLKSKNADLAKAIALLPQSIRNNLSRYKIKGLASFSGSISGDISALSTPSYDFNFSITDGLFADTKSDLKFSNSFLKGSIENGIGNKLETTKLSFTKFETTLNEGKIDGTLNIENFKNPNYEYHGSIKFSLKDLITLFDWDMVLNPTGSINANLDVNGNLSKVGTYELNDWKNSIIKGKLDLIDLGFQYKSKPQILSGLNGQLNFNNNTIEVTNLVGKVAENNFGFSGKLNNLIGFLLEKEEPLFIDATLSSPKVDLAQLLESNEKNENDSIGYELDISPLITVYLNTKIDSLVFNKFKLSNLEADFIVKNQQIDVRNARFNSQEGIVSGDLFIRELKNRRLQLNCKVDLEEVDVRKLFWSFNNFGQSSLKAENISGIAKASIRYSSNWSKTLEIDPKSIEAEIDLTIKNGVLENYEPLRALSKYIDLNELEKVKFKKLTNQILIKNETVIIPNFDLFSSALDVNISGTHTFNNEIDYHFVLLLSQVLNRKVRKPKESEFGYIEDDGLGKSKLFVKMTGTVDEPKFSYDGKQFKSNAKERFAKEKQSVKSILNKEFGVFKNENFQNPAKEEKKANPFQVEIDSSYIKQKGKEEVPLPKNKEEKTEKKSKFGKFMDKIVSPNEEEYVEPKEDF